METPRVGKAVILFLAAAFFAFLAWQIQGPRWMWFKLFCLAAAAICGFFGTIEAINYILYIREERIRGGGEAKVHAALLVANAVKGLTGPQTEIVTRLGLVSVVGILGQEEVNWTVRAPGGDLPLGFIQDWLELSANVPGFLWPVRKHDELRHWPNSEQLCQLATDLFYHRNWAERASGPYPARLLVPLQEVAGKFGVETA